MNNHVKEFYGLDCEGLETPFEDVIDIRANRLYDFEEIRVKCPRFPRGYLELCELNFEDRVEFVKCFWEKNLTFTPHVYQFLEDFFSTLEDIDVLLVKKTLEKEYECHFIYSLKDDYTFYRAKPSIDEAALKELTTSLKGSLPKDYLNFLKIHDGFSKDGDLGLIHSSDIVRETKLLQSKIQSLPAPVLFEGKVIEPELLIPFYKSFGLDVYQCFVKNWYPEKEMGNTLFSLSEGYLSDYNDPISQARNLSFPTFSDWLVFYMEVIDV